MILFRGTMPFIAKESIQAVQKATDIVGLIGEYTKLESRGNDYWGCCPFHNEKTPSFHVEPDKNFYYCFACGAGGDSIKFVMEQEKLSYGDAIEFLAKRAGIQLKYENNYEKPKDDAKIKIAEKYIELYERTASMFHFFLTESPQGKMALEYITKRGLTFETIKKFKLGYSPIDRMWLKKFLLEKNFSDSFLRDSGLFSKKYPDVAFFTNRLMFPIFNRYGQVVAFGGRQLDNNPNSPKYLNSGDLVQYKKGETLYAFNFAKKAVKEMKKIIFCEGYMDCISYHQCGIEYAVAPLGTSLTDEQIHIIRPFVEEVLLSFDSDEAGQKATLRAILMLRKNNITVKVIKLVGGKDPAEIMINFGKEALTKFVESAIIDSNFLLNMLAEKYRIDTPEGKTHACLDFFVYIDALQSDILKEECLEQLCQTFNLKMEAVRRDFQNRKDNRYKSPEKLVQKTQKVEKIKLDAELRSLCAVITDLEEYKILREELVALDFENEYAKELFSVLEKCYNSDDLTLPGILAMCENQSLSNLITATVSRGEYKNNTKKAINDSIKLLKKKSLEKKRDKLMARINRFLPITEDDQKELQRLVAEKMKVDEDLRK